MTHEVTDCLVSAHIRHTARGTVFIPEHSRSAHVRLTTAQRQAKQREDMAKIRERRAFIRQQKALGLPY